MRLGFSPDSLAERAALALGLMPGPVGQTFLAMAVARGVGVAQKMGVFRALAQAPAHVEALADELGAQPEPLRMLLDLLCGEHLLQRARGDRYGLTAHGRRWLDPASPAYLGTWVEHAAGYWAYWADLERIVRGGASFVIHEAPADDPGWATYVRGQQELARLSAGEVATALRLPRGARSLLDVAGGHGSYAAALCRRHEGLRALVVDLPGAAAVGRVLVREAGLEGRIEHRDGDALVADLGGPHDAALCFSILHHLPPGVAARLLRRVRAALRPGGTLAVLDLFRPGPDERRRSSAAAAELFFQLTSGAGTPSEVELRSWLRQAGFGPARRRDLRTLPDFRLYVARAV